MFKRFFTTFLFQIAVLLWFLPSKAQFVTTYYANGKIKTEGCFSPKDSLKQGPWRLYFNNGKLNAEGSYFNGKMHGEWKYYNNASNTLDKVELWKDGEQVGEQKEFYPDGKLYRIINFEKGVYQGASISFYPNGSIRTKGNYKLGMPEGIWENYDENGNLLKEETEDPTKEQDSKKNKRKKKKEKKSRKS